MPQAIVIAGANGAGKTTFARQFLPVLHPEVRFLNVDEIQAEDPALAHSVAAGRELLRRLAKAEQGAESFAIETTLSSRMYVKRMASWKSSGYRISLHFIELPSADYAVRRVALRVATGGHSVPEIDVRRRYRRGLTLFHEVYKPLADRWYHWRSDDRGLRFGEHHER